RNFQLDMSKATIYGKMHNWDRAVEVYDGILSKIQARQNGYDRLRQERVYYELGQAHVNRLQFDQAVNAFTRVVSSNKSTVDEQAGSHMWLGKIFDSGGQRPKAIEQYNAVLKLNCDQGYKDEAH